MKDKQINNSDIFKLVSEANKDYKETLEMLKELDWGIQAITLDERDLTLPLTYVLKETK